MALGDHPSNAGKNKNSLPADLYEVTPYWDKNGKKWMVLLIFKDGSAQRVTIDEAQALRKELSEVICELLIHTKPGGPGAPQKKEKRKR